MKGVLIMAKIEECRGKRVRISANSITIQNDEWKTCGVVRNTSSLYNLQANKQMDYYKKIRQAGLHGKINIKECIISDGIMYIFRNIKSKLWNEAHGYFSEEEKQKCEELEKVYETARNAGFNIIECIYV